MIKELTPEQDALLEPQANKWIQIGLEQKPLDPIKVRETVNALYEKAEYPPPEVEILSSPFFALKRAKELGVEVNINDFCWCQHDAGSVGFYDFFDKYTDVKGIEDTKYLVETTKNLGWTLFLNTHCLVVQRPKIKFQKPLEEVRCGDNVQLHCMDGPAIYFEGEPESDIYAIKGVVVDRYVVMEPEKITVEDIDNEMNAEVRRVKLDQYGQSRYLLDSKTEVKAQDDFGKLYVREMKEDEPLYMVCVTNSSMEPDGTFKDYFLRVNPRAYADVDQKYKNTQHVGPNGEVLTALAAVASTWTNEEGGLIFPDPTQYDESLVKET